MIHSTIGNTGHLLVIVAFVTALVATYAYFKAGMAGGTIEDTLTWKRFARVIFYIHVAAVLGVVFSLYWIIGNHYFEYHYAWKNSSLSLPTGYTISSFWQDQEGSFLLWIFWNVVLGCVLIFHKPLVGSAGNDRFCIGTSLFNLHDSGSCHSWPGPENWFYTISSAERSNAGPAGL
jgi:cytochrome c biogenesis factor